MGYIIKNINKKTSSMTSRRGGAAPPSLNVLSSSDPPRWQRVPLPEIGTLPVLPFGVPQQTHSLSNSSSQIIVHHDHLFNCHDDLDGSGGDDDVLCSCFFDTPSDQYTPIPTTEGLFC
jgi:hypothetical protein